MTSPWRLLWPILLLLLLPLLAAWHAYPDHLPPGFGIFPPTEGPDAPGYSQPIFINMALVVLAIIALYLFPQWFGFKKVEPTPPSASSKLPWWFWAGLITTGFFWWLMWSHSMAFGKLVYYAFSPMWWGFIVMLDGIVYSRSGGKSFITTRTRTFLFSIAVSVVGWCLFEYFDYFVLENWYYPNSTTETIPALSHATVVALFLIAYTTVWPAIFEWYTLLQTFPRLVARYSDGPRIALSGNMMLWGGLGIIVLMVYFPHPLFWGVWVGTTAVFAGTLMRLGIDNPISTIAQGNWSPALLIALASGLNGLFWEFWNHGSNLPGTIATNPNYWIYDIPYVNVIHLFSEMPLLGYFGYLPFGILVWVVFIWAGKLFNVDTRLN